METRKLHWSLLILGMLFSFWMFTTFKLHSDQTQILEKAHKLLTTGEWTHYGNRGTGVGHIPGTFLTSMAAGPMALWYSPYSAMTLILFTQLICLLLFYFPIKEIFGRLSATLFLILFWLSPWRVEQSELYNPSYLFLFSGLHFFTAYKLSKRKSFWMSALNVMAIGFCAQVHFSFLILAFASLFLWVFRMVKINWWGVLAGVLVVLSSLVPYILSLQTSQAEGIDVDTSSGFFLGKNLILVYPVLKAVLYWLRYGSLYFARHIFTEVHFNWIQMENLRAVLSGLFHFIKWPIGIATLLFSILIQWKFLKQTWTQKPFARFLERTSMDDKNWIFHYTFYLFLGMLASAALSPVEFNHWHLILCLPASASLVSVGLAKLIKSHRQWRWLIPALIVYFCIYNSLIAMGSRMHDIRYDYHEQVLEAFPI